MACPARPARALVRGRGGDLSTRRVDSHWCHARRASAASRRRHVPGEPPTHRRHSAGTRRRSPLGRARGTRPSGRLDGLRRPRQRVEREQREPAAGVPPRRGHRPRHQALPRGDRGPHRPLREPGRRSTLRALGEHAQGTEPGGFLRDTRAQRSLARRTHQPLLVRPQPRLASLDPSRVPRARGAIPALAPHCSHRLPRDGQRLDVLLPARHTQSPQPAYA